MKRIKAVFKGENHSLGLFTNMEYEFIIKYSANSSKIMIDGIGIYCEYGSVIKFLENWDNIRVI